jgi:hypothetical protein
MKPLSLLPLLFLWAVEEVFFGVGYANMDALKLLPMMGVALAGHFLIILSNSASVASYSLLV